MLRFRYLVLLLFTIFIIRPAHAETLGEVLSRQDMSGYLDDVVANQIITRYAVFQDRTTFVLAYYLVSSENPQQLSDSLQLLLIDQSTGDLVHKQLDVPSMMAQSKWPHLGSILEIRKINEHYFLKGHLNPSASPTLILTPSLEVHDILPGWVVEVNEEGDIVFQHNMVHFSQPKEPQYSSYHLPSRQHTVIEAPQSFSNSADI